jgi:hypothetical protein
MLSATATVNEILQMLKQPYDATGATDTAKWKRAEILLRLNMAQDELQLEIPDLFKTKDTSLTTTAGTQEYTIPSTLGLIRQVAIDGIQLMPTTKDQIQHDAVRGDLVDATEFVQDWQSVTGMPFEWYQDNRDGVNYLGLYPKPATSGNALTLEGELLLSLMTDSVSSYPFDNVSALRKAQKILVYKTAEVLAAEENNFAYAKYLQDMSEKMVVDLRTYWNVLRKTDNGSTIIYKETEGPSVSLLRREVR